MKVVASSTYTCAFFLLLRHLCRFQSNKYRKSNSYISFYWCNKSEMISGRYSCTSTPRILSCDTFCDIVVITLNNVFTKPNHQIQALILNRINPIVRVWRCILSLKSY